MDKVKLTCLRANLRAGKDVYSEFIGNFVVDKRTECEMFIACDSMYAIYLNDKLLAFGQCADYPHKRFCDRVKFDVTQSFNDFRVESWYIGENSLTYLKGEPFVAFKILQNGKVLAESGANTLSRIMTNYKNGYQKNITMQLGFSFYYDNAKENILPYTESLSFGVNEFEVRPISGLKLADRPEIEVLRQDGGYLIDLGKETVGFLDVDFISSSEQELLIAYGEHVENGNVSRIIGNRDFSVEFKAKAGRNVYLNPFRRLAGRYLQVFCESPLDVSYIGVRPVERNLIEKERKFADPLVRKIYDTSVYTLKCCMHEHYEDCPWREQALYNLDSRNQMLCGYFAFEGFDFQRYNLVLMAHAKPVGAGFMPLCFPAKFDRYIPFFSLAYVMQVCEYIKYTNDKSVLSEVGERVTSIMRTFRDRIDESGLISDVAMPGWNFYEWTEASSGSDDKATDKSKVYDLILNCCYVYVCGLYDETFGTKTDVDDIRRSIKERLFDEKAGLFKFSTYNGSFTQLGNAMAILAGVGDRSVADKMLSEDLVKVSFSTSAFLYDALLTFGDDYKDYILNDIKQKYSKMLDCGATTFWETEKGYKDFNGAGSLCHGWSAIPVYYLSVLCDDLK